MSYMNDFVLRPRSDEQVKANLHLYWQQQNIYISSEYREGEHIQVVVYEDNERILENSQFYVTHGFRFNATANKTYRIRFVPFGKILKLLALEISKSMPVLENAPEAASFETRLSTIGQEMRVLLAIEERNIVLEERANSGVSQATWIYMAYMVGEALLVMLLVGMEIKCMKRLLSS